MDGEIGLAKSSERDDIVSWAAATMYGGKMLTHDLRKKKPLIFIYQTAAGETLQATLLNFILAMVQNPAIQKKAQAEVDNVVNSLHFFPSLSITY